MEEFGIFLIIVVTLNVILFFKIWQATNDIGTIKNHLLGEPIKKQIEVSTKGVLIFSVIFLIAVALIARFGINWVIVIERPYILIIIYTYRDCDFKWSKFYFGA